MPSIDSIPVPPGTTVVFYDGECGLCHRFVLFLLKRDPEGARFLFAPLGGRVFRELVVARSAESLPESIVVLTTGGDILFRSQAVLRALRELGGVWTIITAGLSLLPRALLDWGYNRFAEHRSRFFPRPRTLCPLASGELRGRFLLDP